MLNTAALGACSLLGIATAGMMWFWQDDAALVAAAREQAAAERAHAEAAQAHAEQVLDIAVAGQQEAQAAIAHADEAREHAQNVYSRTQTRYSQGGGGSWSGQMAPAIQQDGAVTVAGFPLATTVPAEGNYRFYSTYGDWRQESDAGEALAAYREADSDDDREEARDKLSEALGEEYDAIIEQHEEHLQQMEERLEKLRDQLEKRREARDDMVAMRVESLTMEADGLGWPTPPNGAHQVWGVPLFSPAAPHAASLPGEPGLWTASPPGATQPAPAVPSVPGVEIIPPAESPADAPDPAPRPGRRPRSGGTRTDPAR
jgi:hypothetical protein